MLGNFREFPEISGMTGNFNMVLCLVQWENKILVYGLHKNNPVTMPNSPVVFLRKCNLSQFTRGFPQSFTYISLGIIGYYILYTCVLFE